MATIPAVVRHIFHLALCSTQSNTTNIILQDQCKTKSKTCVLPFVYSQQEFQDKLATRQPEYDQIMSSSKRRQLAAESPASKKHETPSKIRPWGKTRTPRNAPPSQPGFSRGHSFTRDKSPARAHLAKHWQHLWLVSLERMRRIQERLDYITQKKLAANFSFEEWKKRVSDCFHKKLLFKFKFIYRILLLFFSVQPLAP